MHTVKMSRFKTQPKCPGEPTSAEHEFEASNTSHLPSSCRNLMKLMVPCELQVLKPHLKGSVCDKDLRTVPVCVKLKQQSERGAEATTSSAEAESNTSGAEAKACAENQFLADVAFSVSFSAGASSSC